MSSGGAGPSGPGSSESAPKPWPLASGDSPAGNLMETGPETGKKGSVSFVTEDDNDNFVVIDDEEAVLPFYEHVGDTRRLYLFEDAFIIQHWQDDVPPIVINRESGSVSELTPPEGGERHPVMDQLLTFPFKLCYAALGFLDLLAGKYLVLVTDRRPLGDINGKYVYQIRKVDLVPLSHTVDQLSKTNKARYDDMKKEEKRTLRMLHKLFDSGEFSYASAGYDITQTYQRNSDMDALKTNGKSGETSHQWQSADRRFFWNYEMSLPLIEAGLHSWVTPVIYGYVCAQKCALNNKKFQLLLLSRRSRYRAGTRFNMRGVDFAGNVANYVETEQLVCYDGHVAAFVQIRGSMPLFWRQPVAKSLKMTPKAQLDYGSFFESNTACRTHFKGQLGLYDRVVCINLSDQKGAEGEVGDAYCVLCHLLNSDRVRYVGFDFHKHCAGMQYQNLQILLDEVWDDLALHGYFLAQQNGEVLVRQKGVMRTNCMDCLDRTNVVQSILARQNMYMQFERLGILKYGEKLEDHPGFEKFYKHLWANNADAISKQYSGTGALKTDFTRTGKRSVRGIMNDGVNSMMRYYVNHFRDEERQDVIDIIQGAYKVHNNLYDCVDLESQSDISSFANARKVLRSEQVLTFKVVKCSISGDQRACLLVVDLGPNKDGKEGGLIRWANNEGMICTCPLDALEKVEKRFWSPKCRVILKFKAEARPHPLELSFPDVLSREVFCDSVGRVLAARPEYQAAVAKRVSATVWAGTWNIASQRVPKIDQWISEKDRDIYVLALQGRLADARDQVAAFSRLAGHVQDFLGQSYSLMTSLCQPMAELLVFTRSELGPALHNIHTHMVSCGKDEQLSSVSACSFWCNTTSFTFISSCANSFDDHVELMEKLRLGEAKELDACHQSTHTFWLGSYRGFDAMTWRSETHLHGFQEGKVICDTEVVPGHYSTCCETIAWRPLAGSSVKHVGFGNVELPHTHDRPDMTTMPLFSLFEVSVDPPIETAETVPDSHKCEILMSDLCARDLPVFRRGGEGSSRPQVVIHAPSVSGSPMTQEGATSNPNWEDPLVFSPFVLYKSSLKAAHLLVSVWDDDRVLGRGSIYLGEACGESPNSFTCELTRGGVAAGFITGQVHVQYVEASTAEDNAPSRFRFLLRRKYREKSGGANLSDEEGVSSSAEMASSPQSKPSRLKGWKERMKNRLSSRIRREDEAEDSPDEFSLERRALRNAAHMVNEVEDTLSSPLSVTAGDASSPSNDGGLLSNTKSSRSNSVPKDRPSDDGNLLQSGFDYDDEDEGRRGKPFRGIGRFIKGLRRGSDKDKDKDKDKKHTLAEKMEIANRRGRADSSRGRRSSRSYSADSMQRAQEDFNQMNLMTLELGPATSSIDSGSRGASSSFLTSPGGGLQRTPSARSLFGSSAGDAPPFLMNQ